MLGLQTEARRSEPESCRQIQGGKSQTDEILGEILNFVSLQVSVDMSVYFLLI